MYISYCQQIQKNLKLIEFKKCCLVKVVLTFINNEKHFTMVYCCTLSWGILSLLNKTRWYTVNNLFYDSVEYVHPVCFFFCV